MLQLRADFLHAGRTDGPLACRLIHLSSADGEQRKCLPNRQPPIRPIRLAASGECHFNIRHSRNSDGTPIYTDVPTLDVTGKPIVDETGRALLCEMPCGREGMFYGTQKGGEFFALLGNRAGECLLGAPDEAVGWIPTDSIRQRDAESRWVWSVFDLAWSGAHPALQAQRLTWHRVLGSAKTHASPAIELPYDRSELARIRAIQKHFEIPETWTRRLPSHYFGELEDLFSASVATIDFLLSWLSKSGLVVSNSKRPRPHLVVDSEARIARWKDKSLPINAHADFTILDIVCQAKGKIVTYNRLLRGLKPNELDDSTVVTNAPPEVKEAISHVNRALKKLNCPIKIRNVQRKGYKLLLPDN